MSLRTAIASSLFDIQIIAHNWKVICFTLGWTFTSIKLYTVNKTDSHVSQYTLMVSVCLLLTIHPVVDLIPSSLRKSDYFQLWKQFFL